jgi:hypothetical protein
MTPEKRYEYPVIVVAALCIMAAHCAAVSPDWNYIDEKGTIGDVVVSPDGSSVIVAAGKVLLLSQDGTILAKEPYGEIIVQSGNGNIIVSSYSSVVATTIYVFKKSKDDTGTPSLKKIWETTFSSKIDDFAVSGKGDRIVLAAGGTGVHVYDGESGNLLGHSDEYASHMTISDKGNVIAGISLVSGLKSYTSKGVLKKKFDVDLNGETTNFLMGSDGNIVVFNTGPFIMAYNITSGTELWKMRSSGDISMIAMTPSVSQIITGTSNGAVESYDGNGTRMWTYPADSTENGQAVTAVAITRDGSEIIAGTIDGKVLFLGSDGRLLGIYDKGSQQVRKVAVAADGSLAVAAGDHFIQGFRSGLLNETLNMTIAKTPVTFQTFPSARNSSGSDDAFITAVTTIQTPTRITAPATPSVTVTEYSVIRKATQSPVNDLFTIICIVMLVFIWAFLRREDD